jgi:elongator complex protein 3
MCIETRPDFCSQAEVDRLLEFGATRVELGVQTLSDEIYEKVRRGHKVEDVAKATAILRQNGLKVHYHWMPGLPGSTPENDLELSQMLWDDPRFRPDGLKIYPTMVVEGTELENWLEGGLYQPYPDEVMLDLIARIKSQVPKYVRISRVLRDIPAKFIVGGLRDSLRDPMRRRMGQMGLSCKCIRCREYGFRVRDHWQVGEPNLIRINYAASGGEEIYLSFEDAEETCFGLLRLRIQNDPVPGLNEELRDKVGIVRELHVFGPEVSLSQRQESAAQHRGLGKSLLKEAERLCKEEYRKDWICVLSGIGAREYYRSEGYESQGNYMVKKLAK